jgi:hypothetical protein
MRSPTSVVGTKLAFRNVAMSPFSGAKQPSRDVRPGPRLLAGAEQAAGAPNPDARQTIGVPWL